MPLDDAGDREPSFWNAEWDKETKRYINISPAPEGDGEYNMFSKEIIFAHFARDIRLLGDGNMVLNSSDVFRLGSGMRLKISAETNTTDFTDHDWIISAFMCLHRELTCNIN